MKDQRIHRKQFEKQYRKNRDKRRYENRKRKEPNRNKKRERPSKKLSVKSGSNSKKRPGCMVFISLLLMGIGGYFVLRTITPSSEASPRRIKGEVLNATFIKNTTFRGDLWIVTEKSQTYTKEVDRPGKHSISTECLSCKTFQYIYDPRFERIKASFIKKYDHIPRKPVLLENDMGIWHIQEDVGGSYEVNIDVFDPHSGSIIYNIEEFQQEYTALNAGISSLSVKKQPTIFEIKTNDGRELVFLFEEKQLVSKKQYKPEPVKPNDAMLEYTRFVLNNESGESSRKRLYKEKHNSFIEHFGISGLFSSEPVSSHQIFLEGDILYQDGNAAVIVHQSSIGKQADRMLTKIDKDGKTQWVIQRMDLFEEFMVDEEYDAFSSWFFMQSKVKLEVMDNRMLFVLQGVGLIVFDYNTGDMLSVIYDN